MSDEIAGHQINKTVTQLTSPWMYYFIKYDPTEAIKQTKCPVLVVQGALDCQVQADINLSKIKEALKAGGNKNSCIVKLEGLNHLMQPAKTGEVAEYKTIQTTFDQSALDTITGWIRKTTNLK